MRVLFIFFAIVFLFSTDAHSSKPSVGPRVYIQFDASNVCKVEETCYLNLFFSPGTNYYGTREEPLVYPFSEKTKIESINIERYKYDLLKTDIDNLSFEFDLNKAITAEDAPKGVYKLPFKVTKNGEYVVKLKIANQQELEFAVLVDNGEVYTQRSIPNAIYAIQNPEAQKRILKSRYDLAKKTPFNLSRIYDYEEACFETKNFKVILMRLCNHAYYYPHETGGGFGLAPYTPIEIEVTDIGDIAAKILVNGAFVPFGENGEEGAIKKNGKIYIRKFFIDDNFTFQIWKKDHSDLPKTSDYIFKVRILDDLPEDMIKI